MSNPAVIDGKFRLDVLDDRAAFEAHWVWRKPASECDLSRKDDGTYAHEHVQRHWWTWQCAQKTVKGQK